MPDQTSSSKYSPNLLSQHLREVFESMTAESCEILGNVRLDVTRFDSDVLSFENFESLLIPRRGCKVLGFVDRIGLERGFDGVRVKCGLKDVVFGGTFFNEILGG